MKANYKRDLSTKQIDKLINEQLKEAALKEEKDTMALVCYILSEKFGFGKTRLERFLEGYHDGLKELCDWYSLNESDGLFLARRKMDELGVDIDKFATENLA